VELVRNGMMERSWFTPLMKPRTSSLTSASNRTGGTIFAAYGTVCLQPGEVGYHKSDADHRDDPAED
jgi:hypothetical protein